jgi:tetratricopeptide (TPR) repeat protein
MFGGAAKKTPLDEAQALIYQAVELPDPAERIKLARKALEISGDCADAYVLLAENAPSRKAALGYYEQAVAAGERALGSATFQEEAGHFWGLLETRPYMRAREGLAHALWALARREEAVEHLREMLRLNPHDNQGVRYALTSWLLNLDRDEELGQLIEQFDEITAHWAFTKALLAYRRHGDTPEGRALLKAAHKRNRFVRGWLLGEEPLPEERPGGYSLGSREEAYFYVEGALSAWKTASGAISWVRRVLARPGRRPPPPDQPFEPSALERARLRRLPGEFDVWQVGFRQVPKWLESEGQRVIPWVLLAVSRTSDLVLSTTILPQDPTAEDLWRLVAQAIHRPVAGDPHRPVQIEVRPDARWEALRAHLDELGVDLQDAEELDLLDDRLEDLTEYLLKDEPPGLLEMPRVRPEQVGRLFQAAAEYYRRAPWRSLCDEEAIRIDCARFQSGPWYAVVMGRSGVTLGLALYEDLGVLKRLWTGRFNDPESARLTTALAVTFDPESQVFPKDLDAARRHGWEVVDPEAFPTFYRKEPGMTMRPPLSWELVLLEGCLRAIPAFLARHQPGEAGQFPMTVPAGPGELDLVLSWVDEDSPANP